MNSDKLRFTVDLPLRGGYIKTTQIYILTVSERKIEEFTFNDQLTFLITEVNMQF